MSETSPVPTDHDERIEVAERLSKADGTTPIVLLWGLRSDGTCECLHRMLPSGGCQCGDPSCDGVHKPGELHTHGKHPRSSGWRTDSRLSDVIAALKRSPRANIGVKTGAASNWLVLDEDPRNGGPGTLAALERRHGKLPPGPVARTGSGGGARHHVLAYEPGLRGGNHALGPGLDIKTDGGYILVQPSRSGAGPYRWEVSPFDVKPPPVPEWMRAMLTAPKVKPSGPTPAQLLEHRMV